MLRIAIQRVTCIAIFHPNDAAAKIAAPLRLIEVASYETIVKHY
jgi:hypothetical protein